MYDEFCNDSCVWSLVLPDNGDSALMTFTDTLAVLDVCVGAPLPHAPPMNIRKSSDPGYQRLTSFELYAYTTAPILSKKVDPSLCAEPAPSNT